MRFYGEEALLCQLVLEAGCGVASGRRRLQQIETVTSFHFLFRSVGGDEILIPLTGERGDIHLANRWLGLRLGDNQDRLDYARFYCAFARMERPPSFHNIPREMSELHFMDAVHDKRVWAVYGAMWRFLDKDQPLKLRVQFEPRGLFWLARHRAHMPMQIGKDIFDVDLKIWQLDGHISYRRAELLYRDEILAAEPRERPGKLPMPRYVRWGERLFTIYQNLTTSINQAVYLTGTTLFLLASLVSLLFPIPIWGQGALQPLLELAANITGFGHWTTWLRAACLYCLAYFVLTTLLILDVDKLRNSLLTWSRSFEGSRLGALLYGLILKRQRTESGYRAGLWKRVGWAVTRLFTWTAYLVLIFASLQISFRPHLAEDVKILFDVIQVFGEQALLYIPVVFYYVGRKSLDPGKLVHVASEMMIAFQLIMGLLVIRRVHRFWASTASTRLSR